MALFVGQLTEVGGSEDARLGVYMLLCMFEGVHHSSIVSKD
jgi:hypothetical protein